MATALISALTRRPVRNDTALTGEITLRGRVLGIGGLKEKALAAHRQGIRRIVAPRDNERDLAKIPANIRKDITFIFAANMDQVIAEAIVLDDAQVDTLAEVGGTPVAAEGDGGGDPSTRRRPEFPPPADTPFGDDVAADAAEPRENAARRKRGRH